MNGRSLCFSHLFIESFFHLLKHHLGAKKSFFVTPSMR